MERTRDCAYLTPKARVSSSGIAGAGVFATEPISQHELVAFWAGHAITYAELRELPPGIADLPVRVDRLLAQTPDAHLAPPGSVVFVLTEFQVVDRKRAEANEQGERSHERYKHRQYLRVRERLLRGPRDGADLPGDDD